MTGSAEQVARGAGDASAEGRPARVAVVGVSEPGPCGMRDHGRLLGEELARQGLPCSSHWLERSEPTLRGALAEARAWSGGLADALAAERAEAVVLHYSCFATAHRGVPVLARPLASSLRRSGLPVIAVMHELTYPFGREGVRGLLWAITQRVALLELMRAIDAVIVTTEDRRAWLLSRRWLPRRPVAFAPVFSNLPAPREREAAPRAPGTPPVLGMFGYSYDGSAEVVLRALRRLGGEAQSPVLRLIGSPGADSRAGAAWRAGAAELGLGERISFTGLLDQQTLSDTLANVDLLLFADPPGPTSRKGTLAGSLASGAAVLALDGPLTWREMRDAGAVAIVPRDDAALAAAITEMLGDDAGRAALGARGRNFADTAMGVPRTAAAVRELLAGLVPAVRSVSRS